MGNRSNMGEEEKQVRLEEKGINNMEKEEEKGISRMGKEINHMERVTKHMDKVERVHNKQEPYSMAYAIIVGLKAIRGKGVQT